MIVPSSQGLASSFRLDSKFLLCPGVLQWSDRAPAGVECLPNTSFSLGFCTQHWDSGTLLWCWLFGPEETPCSLEKLNSSGVTCKGNWRSLENTVPFCPAARKPVFFFSSLPCLLSGQGEHVAGRFLLTPRSSLALCYFACLKEFRLDKTWDHFCPGNQK